MELFFEVQRKTSHIMTDVAENGTVADIKKIVGGILNVPFNNITLKRSTNDARTSWVTLDSDKTLLELGFSQKNAKPDEPALLAYSLPEDNDSVELTPLSSPPPLPEQMTGNDSAGDA
ncbi:hypothetical protein M3Y94_00485900 [Aphelenchoides besseyi]|nr:hypothetical protein M3Y94_00485900 [Aphelenchoides besseyi]KAI6217867.1 hypothetical protein M3Y95_01188500 [Aphelenchoides besseyi]